MKVLVINCGSSSLKYQLIDMSTEESLAQGLVERIGIEGSVLTQKVEGRDKYIIKQPMADHKDAIKLVLEALVDPVHGVIKSMDEISAVGHRVVHGGEKYNQSVVINDEVKAYIEECFKLAPLHNPANMIGINACEELMPNTPMVAVFDTSFHQTMEPKNYLYAVPMDWYKNYGVRKYGFHGTSHRFINKSISEYLNRSDLKVISCHIGSGASLCAIDSGRVVDTSMGFSPMTGIMMGTRPGDVDPSVVQYMMDEAGMTIDEVMTALNKKSGLEGICGKSDSRDVEDGIKAGDEACILAQDMYTQKVANYIAMYNNLLNGADVIVFTAGLGENSIQTRIDVMEKIKSLGVKIDLEKNNFRGKFGIISADDSTIPVYVIPTNEELMIAMDTYEIVK